MASRPGVRRAVCVSSGFGRTGETQTGAVGVDGWESWILRLRAGGAGAVLQYESKGGPVQVNAESAQLAVDGGT